MGNKLSIIYPDVNFISNKVNSLEVFTFIKISIEYWMLMSTALNKINVDLRTKNVEYLKSDKFLMNLANNMLISWESQKKDRPWKASKETLYRIIKGIIINKFDNLLIGVTDTGSPRTYPIKEKFLNRHGNVLKFLSQVLDDELKIYSASGWKYWAYTGEIDNFFKSINTKKITIIGPSHLKDFGSRIGAKNFDYINIPDKDAGLHTIDIKDKIIKYNKQSKEYTVYLIQGGGAAMDFMIMAHEHMNNCCMLDIGRALDIYYYYDPIKKSYPKWYWGGWADAVPPTWLKNKTK
jgi:hypothetical protein